MINTVIHGIRARAEAAAHVLAVLDTADIGHAARNKIDLAKGIFFAILPEDFVTEKIENWSDGQLGLTYPFEPSRILCDITKRFLTDVDRRVIARDVVFLASEIESELEPEQQKHIVTYRNEVYWLAQGPNSSETSFEESIGRGTCHDPYLACFYRSGSITPKALQDSDVDEILGNAVSLIVSALADDTFLIWWRTDVVPFPGSDLAPII